MTPTTPIRALRWLALFLLFYSNKGSATPGDLYVSEPESGVIFKLSPDGTKSTLVSGLEHQGGLAFDRAGNLFVAETATGTILKFTTDGTRSTFASGLTAPAGLAFDGAGNLFVTDAVCGGGV